MEKYISIVKNLSIKSFELIKNVIGIAIVAFFAVAWLHNVIACIEGSKWILLIIGTFFPPIGIIHGFMVM